MSAIFHIEIGESAKEVKVICNGHDITGVLSKVVVIAERSALTTLQLEVAHFTGVCTVDAAIEDVTVTVRKPDDAAVSACEATAT